MPSAGRPPNILFFFTDQQRWDTCGCYGQTLPVTPNLDRMAAEGTRFESAFTCQPVCGPARACLQTGKYATEVGCYRNNIGLAAEERTIAHRLSEAGYEVGYIGKWHLASTGNVPGRPEVNCRERTVPPELRGGYADHWIASDVLEFTSHSYDGHMFDAAGNRVEIAGLAGKYGSESSEPAVCGVPPKPGRRYRADGVTDYAVEYLRSRDRRRPWFLFLSFIEPHHQNDHKCYEGPDGSKEKFRGCEVPGDLTGTQGDWRANYPDYLGCCAALDFNLGRIRRELDGLGMGKDTVVFYTSDHGSHFRTRNSEYKRACHDGCIRIPMVACGPGFPRGTSVSELVSLIDVPPTLLAAGGLSTPDPMRGRPLQDLLEGRAAGWPQEVFLQISESHVGRAVRTKKWKYSVRAPDKEGWEQPDSDVYVEDCLYDLEADPHERDNRVRDASLVGARAELRGRLIRRMVEAGEKAPRIGPAA